MNEQQGASPAAMPSSSEVNPRTACTTELLEAALAVKRATRAAHSTGDDRLVNKCDLAYWTISQAIKHSDHRIACVLHDAAAIGGGLDAMREAARKQGFEL